MNTITTESLEQYHQSGALSASSLKHMLRSPAHFRHHMDAERQEPTKAMRFGTLAHIAIIEPRRFLENFKVRPDVDRRTKVGREAMEDFENSLGGDDIPLDAKEADTIVGMIESVKRHPAASRLLRGGVPEQSLYFDSLGVPVRARPDYINPDQKAVIDLKTTGDASYREFQRQMCDLEYPLQAAMQLDGAELVLGWKEALHVWIAIEKEPPYAVAVYASDDTILTKGRQDYMRALNLYKQCVADERWPAYGDDAHGIALPPWMINQFDDVGFGA